MSMLTGPPGGRQGRQGRQGRHGPSERAARGRQRSPGPPAGRQRAAAGRQRPPRAASAASRAARGSGGQVNIVNAGRTNPAWLIRRCLVTGTVQQDPHLVADRRIVHPAAERVHQPLLVPIPPLHRSLRLDEDGDDSEEGRVDAVLGHLRVPVVGDARRRVRRPAAGEVRPQHRLAPGGIFSGAPGVSGAPLQSWRLGVTPRYSVAVPDDTQSSM
eukprot:gene6476-biopygen12653